MYIVPDLDNIRRWHGAIFLRRGPYHRGIFKFIVEFPESFPEMPPSIRFSSCMFHPLISVETGSVDLSAFKNWQPSDHAINILNYLKYRWNRFSHGCIIMIPGRFSTRQNYGRRTMISAMRKPCNFFVWILLRSSKKPTNA